ncbi:unnamed protein product, partial [Pleuronectes platessa]
MPLFDISAKWRMLCFSFNKTKTQFLLWEHGRLISAHSWIQKPARPPPPACPSHHGITINMASYTADHRGWLHHRAKSPIRGRVQAPQRGGLCHQGG